MTMHRWCVTGAGLDDGIERVILVYARDEDDARREAARQRFAVTEVIWDGQVGPPPSGSPGFPPGHPGAPPAGIAYTWVARPGQGATVPPGGPGFPPGGAGFPPGSPVPPRSSLGLTSRTQAWGVAFVGLLLAPVGIGILLLIWGAVADLQLAGWDKRYGRR
jgi:hypothetical protein